MDKKVKKKLDDLLDALFDKSNILKEYEKTMNKALKEPCTIEMTKNKNGKATVKIMGARLPLLLLLAGCEKNILQQLNCSEDEFDFIKRQIGTKEAKK